MLAFASWGTSIAGVCNAFGDICSTPAQGPLWNETFVQAALLGLATVQRPSWSQGTAMSAVLELNGGPDWSIFSGQIGGPIYSRARSRITSPESANQALPNSLMGLAYSAVAAQDKYGRLCAYVSAEEILNAGATFDSLNCAPGVLVAAFANGQIVDGQNLGGYYGTAAARAYEYITQSVKRASNGAISQRNAKVEVWSDSFYMASSLAFYGCLYDDRDMLQLAYDQQRAFRESLRQDHGLMAHIYDHAAQTLSRPYIWCTGNGWAAAGMLRVLMSIIQSSHADKMKQQRDGLILWLTDLLHAAFLVVDEHTGQFHNYMDDKHTFIDSAGSMLLAYSAFRLASIHKGGCKHVADAERIYQAIQGHLRPWGHFDASINTVNALDFSIPGPTSGEALAFAVMLAAARRDYYAGNVTIIDGPPPDL